MKKFVKILAVALVLVLTVGIFASCGGGNGTNNNNDGPVSADVSGRTLVLAGMPRSGRVEINPFYNDNEINAWSEKLDAHYTSIKEKYGIEIEVKALKDEWSINEMFEYVAIGEHYADLLESHYTNLYSFITGGFLLPLNQINGFVSKVDTGKWGNPDVIETLRYGGEYYLFNSSYWGLPFPSIGSILYANKGMLEEYNIDILQIIEDGEWTWDTFYDICVNKIGNDYPDGKNGFVVDDGWGEYFLYSLIFSNGGEICVKDEDGNWKVALDSENAREAMEFAVRLTEATGGIVAGYGEYNKYEGEYWGLFRNGHLAFMAQYSSLGTTDAGGLAYDDELEFYIIPFPTGPKGSATDYGTYYYFAERYWAAPMNADEELLNAVMADLFEPFEGETTDSYKDYYTRNIFYFEESAENYFTFANNSKFAFPALTYTIANDFRNVAAGKKTYQELLESSLESWQIIVDENYNY